MVEYADDDPGETKPIFVKNPGDVKPPVLSHLMQQGRDDSVFCSKKLIEKIQMSCLIGYAVKQIGRNLPLLYVDQM